MRSAPSIVVLVFCLFLLAWPASALAARPVPGGRYLLFAKGTIYGTERSGVLQLSGSGRALTSDGIPFSPVWRHYFGSYLEKSVSCGSAAQDDAVFHLGAPGYQPVPIDSRGRFTIVATGDQNAPYNSEVAQLRGRFVSRSEAVVEIVSGTFLSPQGMTSCPIPHQTFRFQLRPMPPFGTCAKAPGRTVLSTARSRLYKTWGVDETGMDAVDADAVGADFGRDVTGQCLDGKLAGSVVGASGQHAGRLY